MFSLAMLALSMPFFALAYMFIKSGITTIIVNRASTLEYGDVKEEKTLKYNMVNIGYGVAFLIVALWICPLI